VQSFIQQCTVTSVKYACDCDSEELCIVMCFIPMYTVISVQCDTDCDGKDLCCVQRCIVL